MKPSTALNLFEIVLLPLPWALIYWIWNSLNGHWPDLSWGQAFLVALGLSFFWGIQWRLSLILNKLHGHDFP